MVSRGDKVCGDGKGGWEFGDGWGRAREPKFILEDRHDDYALQNKNQHSWIKRITHGPRVLTGQVAAHLRHRRAKVFLVGGPGKNITT